MKNFTLILTFLVCYNAQSQIGIGISNPDRSAVPEFARTRKGFLSPQLTTAERDAISQPAIGLTIFNSTKNCLEWYLDSGWYNACGTNGEAVITEYTCSDVQTGTMKTGKKAAAVTQTINVTISSIGNCFITATANGVTFNARNNFTSIGSHEVVLHAIGTPLEAGTHNFTLNAPTNSCTFARITNPDHSTVSSYLCDKANKGDMIAGKPVNGVTKTITANVTKAGAYTINTTTVNGVTFEASGIYIATGTQNVVLKASGTPLKTGTHHFVINGTPNCSFKRLTIADVGAASYNYNITEIGNLTEGEPVTVSDF